MNTKHIHQALQSTNIAEASRQTGISVRRLFQLRDGPVNFGVRLSTYVTLDRWAKAQPKAVAASVK